MNCLFPVLKEISCNVECFTSLQNIPLFHLFMKILLWDISLYIHKCTWRLKLGTVCAVRKSLILKQSDIYLSNWITDFAVLTLLNLVGMFLFLWSRNEGSEHSFAWVLSYFMFFAHCCFSVSDLFSSNSVTYFDKRAHLYVLP